MRKLKHFITIGFLTLATIYFVQAAGGHLVMGLNHLENPNDALELNVEEKVVKQMILQLEPQEYYTIQLGSYADAASGQETVNALAKAGYRVVVSDGPPYRLWLGCMGVSPSIDSLPEEIASIGSDIFVQKCILNQVLFQFPADSSSELQETAILLASFDVVLKHSLQLFQDYHYEACSAENWEAMVSQVQEELSQIQASAGSFLLHAEDEALVGRLLNLLSVTEDYHESLQLIVDKKNTKVVLLAQSCLLELILYYHDFIEENSVTAEQ